MNKVIASVLLAANAVATVANAVELPDCNISAPDTPRSGGHYLPHSATSRLELDPATLKTGQEITYSRDAPVLNTDYRVVRSGSALVATDNFILKSSWVMNPDWKFRKGQTITAISDFMMPDGKIYTVFSPEPKMVLFMTPEGEFCNRTVKVEGNTWIWLVGKLSRQPESGTLTWQGTDDQTNSGRLRIIFTGASAGAMHFQEVWVKGSQIVSSNDRQFDQFATNISIGGLQFHVAEAKPDSVRISYDFGPKIDLGTNGARMIP